MALRHPRICNLSPVQLASNLAENPRKVRIVDCRSFLEYNDNHIVGAVNICCSKLIKRRLQQEKISLTDLLGYCRIEIDETCDIVIYDQRSQSADEVPLDSFVYVLLKKIILVFEKVYLLSGGFVGFQSIYPEFTENKTWKYPGLTALSQPCMPTTSCGPTRILPFLYLGSEEDANNKELLQSHNITYELNVSNKCPKPDFISDGHFMRIPVNDSHNEKLIPYFIQAFQFIDKARESNESVLVHCLAGISRSPTVAIAYVMRHLQMTCEDAYRYVKAKRATISPNFNFLGQLLEYEKQLVQEKIIEKNIQAPSFSSMSHSADFVLGTPPTLAFSPPTTFCKPISKRLNLSLRFPPGMDSPSLSSPKDSSPTSAMARLQFEKPLGKENRTGCPSSPSAGGLSLGIASLSRPRLVKEQNVTSIQEEEIGQWEQVTKSSLTHHSVSISISKGFKCRKSSIETQQQFCDQSSSSSSSSCKTTSSSAYGGSRDRVGGGCDYGKKFKVHKILIEGSEAKGMPTPPIPEDLDLKMDYPVPSCSSASSIPEDSGASSIPLALSPSTSTASYKREFSRSDSVSTSGIGSEISENELQASGSWEMSESGNTGDDGVFSDCGYSKSPRNSRQLQLWSSDSGHWSSADDGASCSSASIMEVPPNLEATGDSKSPEKRKFPGALFPSSYGHHHGLNLSSLEKRKSYAGDSTQGDEWSAEDVSRPKRWSISEDITKSDSSTSCSEGETVPDPDDNEVFESVEPPDEKHLSVKDSKTEAGGGGGSSSHLNFDNHWFNLLSGRELTCCERQGEGLLYRVHSCPGFLGYRDWLQMRKNVPESHIDEPISDSVLLKMRSCCHRSKHERSFEHSVTHHPWNKNRFSCGNVDYDDLLCKLHNVHDHDAKAESSHSSSSTLASSSFSIVVQ